MGFFSVGNLFTLGITALGFILYHQLNRRNSSGLNKLREYIKAQKEELSAFVAGKEAAVKDYAIDLDVRQQSAKELLNRLILTDADLKKKAEAIARIDERITGYDDSLEELVRMTGRVQENLNRIQDESAFVESAMKRIDQAGEKLRGLEKDLAGITGRFSVENEGALVKAADSILAVCRSAVSDLEASVETLGRRVEDHREAVERVERDREARLAGTEESIREALIQAEDRIRETLDGAVAEAGRRAEKLEDAALVKLREQALERVKNYQETVGEKLKTYQEGTRTKVAEVQALVKDLKESWKVENEALKAEEKAYHEAIGGNIASMETRFTELEERVTQSASGLENLLVTALTEAKARAETLTASEFERWQAAATEEGSRIRALVAEWRESAGRELEEAQDAAAGSLETWRQALDGEERRSREFLAQRDAAIADEAARRERAFNETLAGLESRMEALSAATEAALARGEASLKAALDTAETQAQAQAEEAFIRWTGAAAEEQARWREEAEAEESRWRNAAEAAYTEWRRGFDDSISLWRANAEAAWAEVSGRSEADYQRLDAGREELVSRWQEAEERWRQLSGELSGALDGMAERLAGVERQNTGTAEELRRAIDDNAASLRSGITETAAELRAALEETDSRLQRSLDGTAGRLEAAIGETDSGLQESLDGTRSRLEAALEETGQRLRKSIEDMALKTGQKALEESDRRIEDYRTAQALQFRNLEQAADDVARLEGELRRVMEETEDRVRQDFALFESAAAGERSAAQAAFDEAAEGLRGKLAQIERDVEALKSRAYENVSEKLNLFEEDFAGDLVRRGDAIQEKLDAWQEAQGRILLETGEGLSARWQQLELSLTEDIKTRLAEQRDRMEAELERLKTEADAFETGIRDRMAQGDESLESFKAQITENLAGARSAADAQVKTELGRFSLSMAENLKHARRELEEWQEGISAQIKETTQVMEDLRRKSLEFSTDSDERLASVRSSIAGVNRQIQEFVDQTGLFDQAEKLKTELERRIEDLRGDMDGLDQRRAEAAELENQFTRIKRLEDEVNAKMTRFLSEQRRIELMEADFNRLLQTSQAVEEKLGEVSSSDDLLQAIQVQLRKINDALAETEEKYNRVEKKNQTLETINLGVDRNFKALRETEGSLKALTADLGSLRTEQEQLRQSLEELRSGNEQARAAAERLSFMEQDLSTIEERIKAMQVAREWIAQAETRMQNLNHDMQDQIKLMGEITREEGDGPLRGSNPESIATRENVHKLHRQGWKDEEIAKTLRLSIGEVKLILEVPSRRGG